VLHEDEPTARPQDASHLGDRRGGVGHRAQDEGADDRVDARVREAGALGALLVDLHLDAPARRVATQGGVRIEYGNDLLDLLAKGLSPQEALDRVVAADEGRESRQAGVINIKGESAQWTGKGQYGAEKHGDWVHMRKGRNYAAQGNALVEPRVIDLVADTFEKSEGSVRPLADRLIEALAAGQAIGGDFRHGAKQSAAVVVADPRPGMARRPDGISVSISVCEHPEPVGEMRRVYDASQETLGFRPLQQFAGRDVIQLKLMLHALGYYRPNDKEIPTSVLAPISTPKRRSPRSTPSVPLRSGARRYRATSMRA